MKESVYNVTGMSCAACARTVENALNKNEAHVNIATEKVNIKYDEKKYDFDKIKKIVESSGYGLIEMLNEEEKIKIYENRIKSLKKRLILSVIFITPLFYISMGHMVGLSLPNIINPEKNALIYAMVQLILTLPIIYAGRDFFIHGFKNLFIKSPNMDSLIVIGYIYDNSCRSRISYESLL